MVLCDKCKIETNKIFDDLFCKKCHDARIKHESYLRNKERREAEKRKIQEEKRKQKQEDVKAENEKVKNKPVIPLKEEKTLQQIRDSERYFRNKEYRNNQAKEYYEKNREKIRAQRAKFHEENPDNRKEQQKKRREKSEVKLEMTLRRRARRCLVYGPRCMKILGCSIHFLQLWFKFQFKLLDPLMTLDNHGSYWEIDHVKPVSSFDLNKEEDVKECFHWKNVSPLEKSLNREKSCKILDEHLEEHQKRIELFMKFCKENNITENLNTTLDTAGLL